MVKAGRRKAYRGGCCFECIYGGVWDPHFARLVPRAALTWWLAQSTLTILGAKRAASKTVKWGRNSGQ